MKKYSILIGIAVTVTMVGCATTRPSSSNVYTYRDVPQSTSQPIYTSQPVYVQPRQTTSQEEYNKRIIKQGLIGAATGAIAAEASGGKAGQGALIGAGTNIIGGALLDVLTNPSQPSPQYQPVMNQGNVYYQPQKRIVRQYDSNGNVVSEQEVWQ